MDSTTARFFGRAVTSRPPESLLVVPLLSATLPLVACTEAPAADVGEAAWVRRARDGDATAFRWLFDHHAPRVYRFVRDLLRDEHAADEITQVTFIRAFDRLTTLEVEDRFRPWILGIARNVVRETRRRRWFDALVAFGERLRPDGEPSGDEDDEPSFDTPESRLLLTENLELFERALARLSADRRAVLLLRYDHGLSCAEVSTTLGWTVAKVKVEVHRARAQLRKTLAELHGEDER